VRRQAWSVVSLSVCGVLFGSFAGACSSDDTKVPAVSAGSASDAGGENAGGPPTHMAGTAATDSSGGMPGAGGTPSSDGGMPTSDGGATTNSAAGDGGASGDGGGGDQEPDLEVGPAAGWVHYRGVVNDRPSTGWEQSLAVDLRGNGNAVVVWSQPNETGKNDIVANRYSAGVWGTPQIIDGLPGNAAEPHVTMDGQGNAMAIWQQQDDNNRFTIFYARYVAATASWTTPAPHEVGPAPYNATHPRVAADAAGNVLATWNLEYGTNNVVTGTRVVSSFYKGAEQTPSWTVPQALNSPGVPQMCGRPRVALSSAGHGFVVWNDSEGTEAVPRRVFAAKYLPNGGGFGITKALNEHEPGEEPALLEDVPELVMNDTGQALVIWRQVGESGSVGVALSWYFPEVTQWAAQHNLSEGGTTIGPPALALNKTGDFAVSYWDELFGKRRLVVVHGNIDGQGGFAWVPPAPLLETAVAGSDPALAVDKSGTALLVWTQPLKNADNLLVGRSSPTSASSFGTLQLDLDYGTVSPAVGVYPGTDLALITYYEAYDIHSATTQVE
jgi:hypothetical protein